MRVTFRNADYDALADLWNSVAPPDFPLSSRTLRLHLEGSPVFDWGASAMEVVNGSPVGVVALKRSARALYRGPDPDTAHLSLLVCREPQCAVDLLADAKRILRDRGIARLRFGQDDLHCFPGAPDSWSMLHDFLTIEGFEEGSECFDLMHDLSEYRPPCEVDPAVRPIRPDDVALLLEFLSREFPGRWAYDLAMKLEREPDCGFVYGLFLNGACEGFAVTQDEGSRIPIGGAVFGETLGSEWCALGPVGISRGIRGQGWGDRLLAGALTGLQQAGKRNCRIDWTNLTDWYGRHGFKVERRYRVMTLRLDEALVL